MVVLGDERETALDAYAAAWRFISGDVWWQIFWSRCGMCLMGSWRPHTAFFSTQPFSVPWGRQLICTAAIGRLIKTAHSSNVYATFS